MSTNLKNLHLVETIIFYLPLQVVIQIQGCENIIEQIYDPRIHSWFWAAKNGYNNILIWLDKRQEKTEFDWALVLEFALCKNDVATIHWLTYKHKFTKETLQWATDWSMISGHLKTVSFFEKEFDTCPNKNFVDHVSSR